MHGYMLNGLPFMARATVFALSSRYEGLINVLIEALGVGTPVVATDWPSGFTEILGDGNYGRLVQVGDAPAMAHALACQLDQPTPPDVLRAAAEWFRAGPVAERYLRTMRLADGGGR